MCITRNVCYNGSFVPCPHISTTAILYERTTYCHRRLRNKATSTLNSAPYHGRVTTSGKSHATPSASPRDSRMTNSRDTIDPAPHDSAAGLAIICRRWRTPPFLSHVHRRHRMVQGSITMM
jgi:hypothetical protein